MGERLVTAVYCGHGRLSTTSRRVSRAIEAHMDVVGMAIPRPDLGHPRFILGALAAAQFFFYRSIDQDPFDLGLLRRCSDERDIGRTPKLVIDALSIHGNQVEG